ADIARQSRGVDGTARVDQAASHPAANAAAGDPLPVVTETKATGVRSGEQMAQDVTAAVEAGRERRAAEGAFPATELAQDTTRDAARAAAPRRGKLARDT